MTKPTNYQRWWMEELLDGASINSYFYRGCGYAGYPSISAGEIIHHVSVKSAINKGFVWIDIHSEEIKLTPAGRKALEG